MCEWCGRPASAMARAEVAAELAEARRVRAWHAQRERQAVPLGDGSTAERPPF